MLPDHADPALRPTRRGFLTAAAAAAAGLAIGFRPPPGAR